MKRMALCFLLAACSPARAACEIPQDFWDWPRSADSVLNIKAIRPCMADFVANPKSVLVIRHGHDEESVLHYDELKEWLVSLSVSPARIRDAATDQNSISIEAMNP